MTRRNLLGLLDDAARWGEGTALAHREGLRHVRWSYTRLRETSFRVARELEARGVGRGDRVLLRAGPGPDWVTAFWACLHRAAIVVPLDAESPPELVERVAKQVEPRLRLEGPALPELLAAAANREGSSPAASGIGRSDLAEIVFTSGTTAEPKGVCLTHGNLLANLEPIEEEVRKHPFVARLVRPLRFLSPLPLTHVYGQITCIFVPPLIGAQVFFPHSLKAGEIVDAARRHRISVLAGVPRQLEILREHFEREARARGRAESLARALTLAGGWPWLKRWWTFRDVHRRLGWRFWVFATGGATLPRDTEEFWRRMGFVVLQGYGLTETAALVTLNSPFDPQGGSIGKPLPGTEVTVDAVGQILVRGEAVSPGYWHGGVRPLAGPDGWLATGDLAERDETGALFFRGRGKDVIVTAAGLNVYPEDLEAALVRQPEVRACVVVAFEGPAGPEPLAVLVLRDGTGASDVVARANATLGPYQRMRRWLVWPEPDLPRTASTQKVKKSAVADVVKRLMAGGPAADGPGGALAELIASVGGEAAPGLGAKATLDADLKLDSLGQVELLAAIEERYQVEIDESAVTAGTTLGEIEKLIAQGPAEPGVPYPYPTWPQRRPWRWVRTVLYHLLALPVTRLMCWVRVHGRERLHDLPGPALFVANHVTMVDHALILSALPARFRHRLAIAMEGERLRGWRHSPPGTPWPQRVGGRALYLLVVGLFGVFSLPKRSGFRRSFVFAGESVDRRFSVLVFPEGARTSDGSLRPFMAGIGLLASQLQLPVVPLRIDGLFELKQKKRHFARPRSVSVTIGEAVHYELGREPADITRDLERRVAELATGR